MDSIKLFLVIIVIIVCYMYGRNNIETFFKQEQNLPFQNIPVTRYKGDLFMCKDEWSEKSYNIPFSCHGQSVSQAVFDKYKKSSYQCPSNWLLPGKLNISIIIYLIYFFYKVYYNEQ